MTSSLKVGDVFRRWGPAYRQHYGDSLSIEQLSRHAGYRNVSYRGVGWPYRRV